MFSEDLSQFFADFGVTAVFGSETRTVLADLPESVIAGENIVTGDFKITYPTGYFSGMKYGDSITVNSIAYTVRETVAKDDGAITEAYLSKV